MKNPLVFLKLSTTPSGYDELLELTEEQRGQLLTLIYYLALHPSTGVIKGLKSWTPAKLFRAFGRAECPEECPGFWHYEEDDLIVDAYPVDEEKSLQQQREAGKKGGRPRKSSEKTDGKNRGFLPSETGGLNQNREEKKRIDKNTHTYTTENNAIRMQPGDAQPPAPAGGQGVCVCVCDSTEPEAAAYAAELANAHPVTAQMEKMPPDVMAAARAAYERTPGAAEHAALLRAYMTDNLTEDHRRKPFFRPFSPVQFFAKIESIILEAKRWAKETGYKRARMPHKRVLEPARALTPDAEQTPVKTHSDAISDEERDSIFAEMRKLNEQAPFKSYR